MHKRISQFLPTASPCSIVYFYHYNAELSYANSTVCLSALWESLDLDIWYFIDSCVLSPFNDFKSPNTFSRYICILFGDADSIGLYCILSDYSLEWLLRICGYWSSGPSSSEPFAVTYSSRSFRLEKSSDRDEIRSVRDLLNLVLPCI